MRLLPAHERSSQLQNLLFREIFAGSILRPLVSTMVPDTINHWLMELSSTISNSQNPSLNGSVSQNSALVYSLVEESIQQMSSSVSSFLPSNTPIVKTQSSDDHIILKEPGTSGKLLYQPESFEDYFTSDDQKIRSYSTAESIDSFEEGSVISESLGSKDMAPSILFDENVNVEDALDDEVFEESDPMVLNTPSTPSWKRLGVEFNDSDGLFSSSVPDSDVLSSRGSVDDEMSQELPQRPAISGISSQLKLMTVQSRVWHNQKKVSIPSSQRDEQSISNSVRVESDNSLLSRVIGLLKIEACSSVSQMENAHSVASSLANALPDNLSIQFSDVELRPPISSSQSSPAVR